MTGALDNKETEHLGKKKPIIDRSGYAYQSKYNEDGTYDIDLI